MCQKDTKYNLRGKKIMKGYKKSADVIKKSFIIFFGDILSYLLNIEF